MLISWRVYYNVKYNIYIFILLYYGFVCTDADISTLKPRPDPYLVLPNRAFAVRERGKTRWKTKLEN